MDTVCSSVTPEILLLNLIEIIRLSFKTTVLIYRDKQAQPWPCSAPTWIAAPAPSQVPSISSGLFFFLTMLLLFFWWCGSNSYSILRLGFYLLTSAAWEKKIYVNSTSVNRSTPLSVPTDQRYWLHNALFTRLLPSLCCHYQTVCTKKVAPAIHCERERATSAIIRRA